MAAQGRLVSEPKKCLFRGLLPPRQVTEHLARGAGRNTTAGTTVMGGKMSPAKAQLKFRLMSNNTQPREVPKIIIFFMGTCTGIAHNKKTFRP